MKIVPLKKFPQCTVCGKQIERTLAYFPAFVLTDLFTGGNMWRKTFYFCRKCAGYIPISLKRILGKYAGGKFKIVFKWFPAVDKKRDLSFAQVAKDHAEGRAYRYGCIKRKGGVK